MGGGVGMRRVHHPVASTVLDDVVDGLENLRKRHIT
jgi:hypothetical protein